MSAKVTRVHSMQLLAFTVLNYKRIRVARCTLPEGKDFVVIGGENGNGKSSAAEAIMVALRAMATNGLKKPVNTGAPDGKGYGISLTLGNPDPLYTITTYSNPDGASQGIKVKYANGDPGEVKNPQEVIRELLGASTINPLKILAMEPVELRRTLMEMCGLDVDAMDEELKAERKEEARLEQVKLTAEGKVAGLAWHDDAPEKEISGAELVSEHARGSSRNNEIQRQAHEYRQAQTQIETIIKGLREDDEKLKTFTDQLVHRITELSAHVESQTVDLAELTHKIENIESLNSKFRDNQARIKAAAEWHEAEANVGKQNARVKELEAAKKQKLKEAKLPIEGIGFDSKEVTLNGIPFSQVGKAERIRVAVSICLYRCGALPLIIIDDAEALDHKSMRLLIDALADAGAQCVAFSVANQEDDRFDKDCDFYIVDGELKSGADAEKLRPVKPALTTSGKGGEDTPPPVESAPLSPEPRVCPECGGKACGPTCMNGDAS